MSNAPAINELYFIGIVQIHYTLHIIVLIAHSSYLLIWCLVICFDGMVVKLGFNENMVS